MFSFFNKAKQTLKDRSDINHLIHLAKLTSYKDKSSNNEYFATNEFNLKRLCTHVNNFKTLAENNPMAAKTLILKHKDLILYYTQTDSDHAILLNILHKLNLLDTLAEETLSKLNINILLKLDAKISRYLVENQSHHVANAFATVNNLCKFTERDKSANDSLNYVSIPYTELLSKLFNKQPTLMLPILKNADGFINLAENLIYNVFTFPNGLFETSFRALAIDEITRSHADALIKLFKNPEDFIRLAKIQGHHQNNNPAKLLLDRANATNKQNLFNLFTQDSKQFKKLHDINKEAHQSLLRKPQKRSEKKKTDAKAHPPQIYTQTTATVFNSAHTHSRSSSYFVSGNLRAKSVSELHQLQHQQKMNFRSGF